MGAGALITTRTAPNDFTRYTLTKLDERGLAASSVDFQLDFGSRGGPGASIQLASQGGRVRLFYANGGVGSVAFDPDGNRQASSDVQLIAGPTGAPSDEPLFAATITDSAMAVLWLRLRDPVAEGPFSVDVVLSTFAADGTPRGAPFVLGQQLDSRSVGSLRISGSGGRVLATWRDGAGDPTVHHAARGSSGFPVSPGRRLRILVLS